MRIFSAKAIVFAYRVLLPIIVAWTSTALGQDDPDITIPSAPPVAVTDISPVSATAAFYAARNNAPAWTGSAEARRRREIALGYLRHADAEGLDPDVYEVRGSEGADAAQNMAYDAAVTAAVLHYAHDLRSGEVVPQTVFRDVGYSTTAFDAAGALNRAIGSNALAEFFRALPPPHPEYAALRRALATYRGMSRRPGAPVADASGRSGGAAQASANDCAARIAVNMERWRWVPREFGPSYIEVNTADTTLKAVEGGEVVLTSRIVAGKPSSPTPMFSATVEAVTVNPYWNVPSGIARREIWPHQRRNSHYLASHHMFVQNGQVRQRPGGGNSLGRLKLEMPNRFNAYLHDTPAKSLFSHDERHASHGCMRVQNIRALASYALTRSPEAGIDRLDAAIAAGHNRRIDLDKTLPVYVVYWTASANGDGSVEFHPDAYGRDSRLWDAIVRMRPHQAGQIDTEHACRLAAG